MNFLRKLPVAEPKAIVFVSKKKRSKGTHGTPVKTPTDCSGFKKELTMATGRQ